MHVIMKRGAINRKAISPVSFGHHTPVMAVESSQTALFDNAERDEASEEEEPCVYNSAYFALIWNNLFAAE